jgi:hypothetical protein
MQLNIVTHICINFLAFFVGFHAKIWANFPIPHTEDTLILCKVIKRRML